MRLRRVVVRKQQLRRDEGKAGEWAWSQRAGRGMRGWNLNSDCRRLRVFRDEGVDLVCGEGAIGELLQTVVETEADVEPFALGTGYYEHVEGHGRAAGLGSQMHPIFAVEGDRRHGVLTRSACPVGRPRGCPYELRSGSHQLLLISTEQSAVKTQKSFY